MPTERSFLDTLSGDARLIIARKCSRVPRCESWRNEIGSETLGMMFDPRGPFVKEVGLLFPEVRIDKDLEPWRNIVSSNALAHDGTLQLLVGRGRDHLALDLLADTLEGLAIRSSLLCGWILRQVVCRCRDVRVLCLKVECPKDESWLKVLSCLAPSVEAVDIEGVNAAVKQLSFDLEFPRIKQLRVLWHAATPEKNIDYSRLFKVLGRGVEVLHLNCHGVPKDAVAEMLRDVRKYCRMLRTIHAMYTSHVTSVFAELLISYGSQLLYVDFDAIRSDAEACAAVLEACPNVLGLATTYEQCALDGIAAVAPRLEEWNIARLWYGDQLASIASRCGALRRLSIGAEETRDPAAFARFFESFETTSLRVLQLRADTLTVPVLRTMRRSAVRLRKVDLYFNDVECLDALGKLFESCECLEDVHFRHRAERGQAHAFKLVTRLVDSLSKQPKLKRLEIKLGVINYVDRHQFSTAIANAVQVFRFRPTYVDVDWTTYFT